MKVSSISGDMVVKLAIGAAILGAGIFAFYKIKGALPGVATAINPADPGNIINRGANAVGGALVTDPEGPGKNADGSWTLGGFIFDIFHSDAGKESERPTPADQTAPAPVIPVDPYDFIFTRQQRPPAPAWDETPGIY